jgi:hypothetical protein
MICAVKKATRINQPGCKQGYCPHDQDVMIHDVTNPPLGRPLFCLHLPGRIRGNCRKRQTVKSMYGVLNQYPDIQHPKQNKGYNYQLSAVLAMFETAAKLQPSGTLMVKYEGFLFRFVPGNIGFSSEVIDSSKSYAKTISKRSWLMPKPMGTPKISNYPRYKLSKRRAAGILPRRPIWYRWNHILIPLGPYT